MVAVLGAGFSGCGSSNSSGSTPASSTISRTSSDGAASKTSDKALASSDEEVVSSDEAAVTSQALMPDVPCGTDLQDAQDEVQAAGVFFSRSEDATGQDRNQIIDSNWTVVSQQPAPGTSISEGDPVFQVVKDEEFSRSLCGA